MLVVITRGDYMEEIKNKNVYTKPVKGNSRYIAYSDGRIYDTKREKFIPYHTRESKYQTCTIGDKTWLVHRVIASTFIPNPESKPQVNHIDGDKTNNSVENLEWCTAKENIQHSRDTGLMNTEVARSVLNKKQSKPVKQIDKDTGEVIAVYPSISVAEANTGARAQKITVVCQGKRNTAGGFNWEYVNPEDLTAQTQRTFVATYADGTERIFDGASSASRSINKNSAYFNYHIKKKGNPFTHEGITWKRI